MSLFSFFLISIFSIFLTKYLFTKWNIVDNPQKYGHTRKAIPYPLGVIAPFLFFLFIFSNIDASHPLYESFVGVFIASFVLLSVCFYDDRKNLPSWFRLIIHMLCALIIIKSGVGIEEIRIPFHENISLPPLFSQSITFLWIVFMINAFNWTDGISGLSSSLAFSASSVLALTAYTYSQAEYTVLFLSLAVLSVAFFLGDIPSPKFLLGDSGSMFFGLILAVFTLISGGKVATALIVLFVPIFDAFYTIFRRLKNKTSPFQGDKKHLHHKLLEKTKSEQKTVLFYLVFTLVSGIFAVFLNPEQKSIFLLFLIFFLFFVETILHSHHS
jgi:UDP-GlcNAc:undecaprenyl-phosphate GlcNAc-1-phosphate transferase